MTSYDANNIKDSRILSSEPAIHKTFHISLREAVAALIIFVFYLLSLFVFQNILLLIIGTMAFAIWLTFRASHFAIEGLESLGAIAGLSAYFIGALSSLASNTPEAVVSALTAWRGYTLGNPELVEIAVLSVIMAAGFNILLLGIVVVLSTRKTREVEVPSEVVKDDADLIRWTIVVMVLLVAFSIFFYMDFLIHGLTPGIIPLPPVLGFLMVLSYVFYAIYSVKKPSRKDKLIPKARHSKRNSAAFAIIGFVGIFIAGYLLTGAIELTFDFVPWTGLGIIGSQRIAFMALMIGAVGALPEHGIAVIAATKGKADIAIGNTLGGTTQVLLLIVGGVAMFLPLPLDAAVLLQFTTAAGSLWFLKRALTDDKKVDIFEGAMVLLMQAFVFILALLPI
ncbi:MAG: sodium:calcium antiporter [Promethearchaeota archaeon]